MSSVVGDSVIMFRRLIPEIKLSKTILRLGKVEFLK